MTTNNRMELMADPRLEARRDRACVELYWTAGVLRAESGLRVKAKVEDREQAAGESGPVDGAGRATAKHAVTFH